MSKTKPPVIKNILIIGLGLVSGSIMKLWQEVWGSSLQITVIARRPETMELARAYTDKVFQNIKEIDLKQYDLVLIGLPIKNTIELIPQIGEGVKDEAVILDISSVKQEIMQAAEDYKSNFIGGHPMAGSEKKGFENASAEIMRGAKFVLTPFVEDKKYQELKKFLESSSFKVMTMSAEDHDRRVAAVSHMPYMVAVALLNAIKEADLSLASTGLQSITRVAAADPLWGKEIAAYNREQIVHLLEKFEKIIRELRYNISNERDILFPLVEAKSLRDKLYEHQGVNSTKAKHPK